MKKILLKILKYRTSAVSTIFITPVITEEWILFGKFIIFKSYKST
ncbi:hypothetical protein [Chryseobacterium scophthalmum]|nr:hypothetical protein [Chryseobacterium scophthalmum]